MDRMEKPGEIPDNGQLDGLWTEYRSAFPDRESGPDFMPKLWQRIEARRVETTSIFRRLAQVCVAATAMLLILFSTLLTPPSSSDSYLYSSTYADIVAADHADNDYVQALPAVLPTDSR
jgi:hypothetical protein